MTSSARLSAAVLTVLATSLAGAADLPPVAGGHLHNTVTALGDAEARAAIEGLGSRANCESPSGTFTTEVVSLAGGTVRLMQRRESGVTELLIASDQVYARSAGGAGMEPAEASMTDFVRGHDVHRLLLDLDRRFDAVDGESTDDCFELRQKNGAPASICTDPGDGLPRKIVVSNPAELGGGRVSIEMNDWQQVAGIKLPFSVDFVHRGERFTYRYHTILPFRIAPGSPMPDDPTVLFERLGDLAEITAVHERAMAAHRTGDIDALIADQAEAGTVSTRGHLIPSNREDTRNRLGPYLASTRFSRYADTVVPVVAVAADGSLGWLACEMEAEGTQTVADREESLEFGFSWFEMLARKDDRWVRIGNASNQRR